MKKCIKCEFEGNDELFRKNKNTCLKCYKEYSIEYYNKNKERLLLMDKERRNKIIEGNKICRICNIEQPANYFVQNTNICFKCRKIERQNYYKKNKKEILDKQKKYHENNKEVSLNYYNLNKDKISEKNKKYHKENKDKINKQKREYEKHKIKTDPLYSIMRKVKSLISISIRNNGYTKKSRTNEILDCTYEEFKIYLESKFEPWMNWDNKGLYNGEFNYGWDIDHIIPTSSANTEEELIKLNHYTNLQPLCSKINRDIKRNKVD